MAGQHCAPAMSTGAAFAHNRFDDDPDRRPYFGEIMRELEAMNFKNIG